MYLLIPILIKEVDEILVLHENEAGRLLRLKSSKENNF